MALCGKSNNYSSVDMEVGKELVLGAWDYKGRPAERSKTGGWKAAAMILGHFTQFFSFLLYSIMKSIFIHLIFSRSDKVYNIS